MTENTFTKYDFGSKCVCVGRVSTSSQSQTAQINDLKVFAQSLGYKEVQPFFTTESGFLEYDEKQGWNIVVDFFETHPDYRVLICTEISRLSRKEAILFKIKDYLIEHKIQLVIKDINYFLFNEWGEVPKGNDIVFALYASLADSEMRQKKERFQRGLKEYRQLGYSIGGKVLFGYERYYEQKNGKNRSRYRINEKEAEEIITIYKWYAYGIDGDLSRTSILSITRECIERGFSRYLHSKRNVNKCLKEDAYSGQKITHNRVKNPAYWNYKKSNEPKYLEARSYICTYPPIFTGENSALIDKVRERLKENNSKLVGGSVPVDKSRAHTTILSKLLVCPGCGSYLSGEYTRKIDSRGEKPVLRYSYTYRCANARGRINNCQFKSAISMITLDSVIWHYCRVVALQVVKEESKEEKETRVKEIEAKIANVKTRIEEFNYEGRVRTEETIFRSKAGRLGPRGDFDAIVKEYEARLAAIDKEINGYEKRLIELEEEKEAAKNSKSFYDLNQRNAIPANKKLLYQHIHKVIKSIGVVCSTKDYVILKVNWRYKPVVVCDDEYICINKRITMRMPAFTIRSTNTPLREIMRSSSVYRDSLYHKSRNKVIWDTQGSVFLVGGFQFSPEELFAFCKAPYDKKVVAPISFAPVLIEELDYERLACYEEDCKKEE